MPSYNIKSSYDNAWSPSFFDCSDFGDELKDCIRQFQKDHGLTQDGLCGPKTAYLVRERIEGNFIFCGSSAVPIKWDQVTAWPEQFKASNFRRNYLGRRPRVLITHWDAALSSASAWRILERRRLSAHFLISNTGKIHQCGNTSHVLYHAGRSNGYSVGIEISNAYYLRYQERYRDMGLGDRPVMTGATVHGRKMRDHTGFYPVQLEAYKALIEALCNHYDIPIQTPTDDQGNDYNTVYAPAFSDYEGIIHHYQVDAGKIDCGSLSLSKLIADIRG